MKDRFNIQYHSSFIHKGHEKDLLTYKDIILFPNAAENLFPHDEGRRTIYEEDICFNIRLQKGLNIKKFIQYKKNLIKQSQDY